MRKIFFILLFPSIIFAQDGAFRFFISFTDKANTNFSIDSPEEYLSEKTINKRFKFSIPIDSTDLPVNKQYIDVLESEGLIIENISKWFNGILVSTFDSLLVYTLNQQFIDTIISFGGWHNSKEIDKKWDLHSSNINYAESYNQLEMIGGDNLHSMGYQGSGIMIAVIDAGFYKVDQLDAFSDVQHQIVATYDFVDRHANVYDDHSHGMMVLSTMAVNKSGIIMGTAPQAQYILLRSEDVFSENLIEEYMWVCAAEFADSIGADIINSSLGYTTFDNVTQNHSYTDMDGKHTPISIGAGIAFSKGIIVVNSAGNSGNNKWHYIGAPADHPDVLTVGAIDENKQFALFSSYGPNAEGFVKPNVVAQGKNTVTVNSNNEINTSNGTSFSSPLIAGMAACLWGANIDKTAGEVKQVIYKSADKYLMPDDQFGYGIPDFLAAHNLLNYGFNIRMNLPINTVINYKIFTIEGKLILEGKTIKYNISDRITFETPRTAGVYIINVLLDDYEISEKFIVLE